MDQPRTSDEISALRPAWSTVKELVRGRSSVPRVQRTIVPTLGLGGYEI